MKLETDISGNLCWITSGRPFRVMAVGMGAYNRPYSSTLLSPRHTPSSLKKFEYRRIFSISAESRDVFEEIKTLLDKKRIDYRLPHPQGKLLEAPKYRRSFKIQEMVEMEVVLHVKPGRSGMKKFCSILSELREKDILCIYGEEWNLNKYIIR